MGLFDFFLKDRPKVNKNQKVQTFKMLNGYEPKFTSFGGDISGFVSPVNLKRIKERLCKEDNKK